MSISITAVLLGAPSAKTKPRRLHRKPKVNKMRAKIRGGWKVQGGSEACTPFRKSRGSFQRLDEVWLFSSLPGCNSGAQAAFVWMFVSLCLRF